ncbi:TIGR03560 family F420-dependent LLM class oxidoreductase [Nocardia sp. NPDC051030]|uniref:TIGR03560 family F420-dependent LLM class oxidoreductase n=1 Tax=Nocardia sp. NPDC051030 TaxID=3155162 RepID=UPI0034275E91
MTFRLGYHIPFFNHDVPPAELFPRLVAQARAAEAAGFDLLTVMDHLVQPPLVGAPDEPILEAYTTLAALAGATERIHLATMVTSNTYRNPAVLAKIVTTLDVISGGRAALGLGAGWFELEHQMYGIEFGSAAARIGRLAEALDIIVPMLRGKRPTAQGTWYRAESAVNEPRMRDDLPVLIGGSGERKTFALAALHADHLNILCVPDELPRKMAAVRARCAEIGRDPGSLPVSFAAPMIIDADGDEARRRLREFMLKSGTDIDELTDAERAAATGRFFVGSPGEISARLRAEVLEHGITGLAVNLVADGDDPRTIELAGRTLAPLMGRLG